MIIYRLLRDLRPETYCLISRQESDATKEYSSQLPGRRYHLPPEPRIPRGARYGAEHVNAALALLVRAGRITRIVRREKCVAVVGCSGDPFDLPASYLASRMTGAAFYAYYFDYYSYQLFEPHTRYLVQRSEPIFLKGAAGIIAPNEMQCDALRERYGVGSTLIRNPCDIADYEMLPGEEAAPPPDGETRITYTGAVSPAHYDAFRNLVGALRLLRRADIKLHLYTAQPPSDLARLGISGPIVIHEHQPQSAIPVIQRQSDLLFLPLAFNSPYPELVRTAATTKLGEYLASQRPMLVHAPADSFIAWYCQQHQCGLVVGENDPARLAEAIDSFMANRKAALVMGQRNWELARADFSIEESRARFTKLLGLEAP
jgi:glycosyltransferase involved in cell wall biosynthesis